MKSLDAKLAEIKANRAARAFILADAKDADMAFGVRAPGPRGYLSANGARPAQFSPEKASRVGISIGLIRLSTGIESADDTFADLESALKRGEKFKHYVYLTLIIPYLTYTKNWHILRFI